MKKLAALVLAASLAVMGVNTVATASPTRGGGISCTSAGHYTTPHLGGGGMSVFGNVGFYCTDTAVLLIVRARYEQKINGVWKPINTTESQNASFGLFVNWDGGSATCSGTQLTPWRMFRVFAQRQYHSGDPVFTQMGGVSSTAMLACRH